MSTTRHQSRASEESRNDAKKLHVVTFGCQMNKYDSELVEGRFKRDFDVTTSEMSEADVVLFNTCSVRDHAEERTWSWVGELKRVGDIHVVVDKAVQQEQGNLQLGGPSNQ